MGIKNASKILRWGSAWDKAVISMLTLTVGGRATGTTSSDEALLTESGAGSIEGRDLPPFFIQDPADGLCLSGGLFKRCAIDTLWRAIGDPGDFTVRQMEIDEDALQSPGCKYVQQESLQALLSSGTGGGAEVVSKDSKVCLDRKSCDSMTSALRLGNCDHCGAKGWTVIGESDSDRGYALSVGLPSGAVPSGLDLGMSAGIPVPHWSRGSCVVRDGDTGLARMGACDDKARLSLQFASREDLAAMSEPGVRLITAASDGDKKAVKKWLMQGIDVDSRDWDNLTPIIAAASQGHLDVVKLLLEWGADVNCKDKDDITALMEASIMDHRDVVKHLLKEGAEVDAKTTTGVTALWLACGEGRKEVALSLLTKGADVNNSRRDGITAVMAAAVGGHKEVVRMLVEGGAGVSQQDQDGLTALMNASEIGAGEIVTYLLNKGADPNVMSHTGFTALILAAAGGHLDVVKTLVEKGAMVNADHPEGVNALMYAAAGAHLGVVQYLVYPTHKVEDANGNQVQANVNQLHVHGGSALMEASTSGNVGVINLLIKKAANVTITDKDGVTTLMSAASHGHHQACKVLLEAGAELDAVASSGGTALMFAAAAGYTDVVKLLLQHGSDPNTAVQASEEYKAALLKSIDDSSDKGNNPDDVEAHTDGVTALMLAALGGHMDCVKVLVEAGTNVTAVDEAGVTALLNAVKGNFGDVASYLVEKGANANDVYVDEEGDRHSLLMDAIIVENIPFAELLISHGADVNVRDEQGVTTLIQAAHRGMDGICELVLSKGVNPSAKSDDGITALIAAASEGHTDIVKSLLDKANANADDMDKDGTTALMAASVRGHKDVVDVLLSHGAELNAQNNQGHTALMFAYNGRNQVAALLSKYSDYIQGKEDAHANIINDALQVHTKIVEALLAKGADASMLDKDGHSAEDFDFQGSPVGASKNSDPHGTEVSKQGRGGAGSSSPSYLNKASPEL